MLSFGCRVAVRVSLATRPQTIACLTLGAIPSRCANAAINAIWISMSIAARLLDGGWSLGHSLHPSEHTKTFKNTYPLPRMDDLIDQ